MSHTYGYDRYACSLKFSLRATIDHGASIHSGHYTASIEWCKKHYIVTTTKLLSLKLLITKTPQLHIMSFGLKQDGGSLITPMALTHPLHPINSRSRNKRRNLWVGRCAPPPPPPMTCVPVQKFCVNIYLSIRKHSLYKFCYTTYIFIHKKCRSVLVKLHPITVYRTVWWGVRDSCVECHFFLWFTKRVLLYDK